MPQLWITLIWYTSVCYVRYVIIPQNIYILQIVVTGNSQEHNQTAKVHIDQIHQIVMQDMPNNFKQAEKLKFKIKADIFLMSNNVFCLPIPLNKTKNKPIYDLHVKQHFIMPIHFKYKQIF